MHQLKADDCVHYSKAVEPDHEEQLESFRELCSEPPELGIVSIPQTHERGL